MAISYEMHERPLGLRIVLRVLSWLVALMLVAVHPVLLIVVLIVFVFSFRTYVDVLPIAATAALMYGTRDVADFALLMIVCIALFCCIEWSKTRLIAF